MCFSANVSFVSAGILALIGITCFALSKTKGDRFVSSIPLFFSTQQLIEGLLWLTLPTSSSLSSLLPYAYLFFALIWWPIWMPICIAVYETNFWRKGAIGICAILGICCGIFYLKQLFLYGATASIHNTHIAYNLVQPFSLPTSIILTLLYFVCAIIPFFISSRRYMWALGAAISASYVISFIFYYANLGSIWCFCAAAISALTLWIMWQNQKEHQSINMDSDYF